MSNLNESTIDLLNGQWRLLEVVRFTEAKGRAPHKVLFRVAPEGVEFEDPFFASPKAITRLQTMLGRAGYDEEKTAAMDLWADDIAGLRVWARLIRDDYNGKVSLRTDGWNFRGEEDGAPVEESETVTDYGEQDAEARAMEGL
jgi:hypothetical protein